MAPLGFLRNGSPFLLALTCLSCSQSTSEPRHTATLSSEKGLWASLSQEDARSYVQQVESVSTLPASNPIVVRLSAWAAALDAGYRRKADHPELIPFPRIFVSTSGDVNAHSKNANVCFPTRAHFVPTNATEAVQEAKFITFSLRQNELGYANDRMCIDAEKAGLRIEDVVEAYAKSADASVCRLALEGGILTFSGNCGRAPGHEIVAEKVSLSLSSNVVVINLGLVKTMDEDLAAAAVAHELGHFYHAHVSRPANRQGFLYQQKEGSNGDKESLPTTDPGLLRMARELQTKPMLDVHHFEGQKFHYMAVNALLSSNFSLERALRGTCGPRCEEPCADLFASLHSPELLKIVRRADFSTASNRSLYSRMEDSLARCTAEARVSDADDFSAISYKVLADSVGGRGWAEDLYADLKAQSPTTLLEAMKGMTRSLDAAQKSQNALRRDAVAKRLGWYSIEQEADDVAIELLVGAGVHPKAFQDLMFNLLKEKDGIDPVDTFDYETCRKAFDAGWKDERGQPLFVPVGQWDDIHHSQCYRIFNTDREVRGHDWHIEDNRRPSFEGPSWKELQHSAEELIRRYQDRNDR